MLGEQCIRKAYAYILKNDFEEAIYWFEQAISLEPDNASYYHKCAVSCSRSLKWAKAKVYADDAERLEPDNEEYRYHSEIIEARLLLAEANMLISSMPPQLMEAENKLIVAVSLDVLCFEAHYMLALVYVEHRNWDQAIIYAREALKLEPQHTSARRLFADISRKRRMERIRNTIKKGKG